MCNNKVNLNQGFFICVCFLNYSLLCLLFSGNCRPDSAILIYAEQYFTHWVIPLKINWNCSPSTVLGHRSKDDIIWCNINQKINRIRSSAGVNQWWFNSCQFTLVEDIAHMDLTNFVIRSLNPIMHYSVDNFHMTHFSWWNESTTTDSNKKNNHCCYCTVCELTILLAVLEIPSLPCFLFLKCNAISLVSKSNWKHSCFFNQHQYQS